MGGAPLRPKDWQPNRSRRGAADRVPRRDRTRLALAPLLLFAATATAAEPPTEPGYARGYADAILSQVFSIEHYQLAVEGDTLRVTLPDSEHIELDKLSRALLEIEGVDRVVIEDAGEVVSDASRSPDEAPAGWELFPAQELFAPLLADPRWPRFSAIYQWYRDDPELGHAGAVSFGESFALVRSPETRFGRFEFGAQASVFSLFDLEAESNDLVNADYMVGLTGSNQIGHLTTLLRLYHQSSHLGDEYLLRNSVDRDNLSFEAFEALLSVSPTGWLRLYGGGGALLHSAENLDPGLVQTGAELESPRAFLAGHVRPLAGVDVQLLEETDWRTDLSVRWGVQIEHPTLRRLRVQLMGEYYRGRSPNGQFYERRIENFGIGVYLGF